MRLMVSLLLFGLTTASYAQNVTTVPYVDLNRYAGKWYEIASFPQFFLRKCTSDTTSELQLKEDGSVGVTNGCMTVHGWDIARGRGRIVKDTGNAQIKVTFFWVFTGNYWIIGLDPDYRWAVIGDPTRKYLWIISRSKTLSAADLEKARQAAIAQGYDLTPLNYTKQNS